MKTPVQLCLTCALLSLLGPASRPSAQRPVDPVREPVVTSLPASQALVLTSLATLTPSRPDLPTAAVDAGPPAPAAEVDADARAALIAPSAELLVTQREFAPRADAAPRERVAAPEKA